MPENNSTSPDLVHRYIKLTEITRDIASTLDLEVLLNRICNAAVDLTCTGAASILLYDESLNEIHFQASSNLDQHTMRGLVIPVENSIAGAIITDRKPYIVNDTRDDPRHFSKIGKDTNYLTKSLLGVPMIHKDKVVGALEVLNKMEADFNEDDVEILTALATQAAIAIENTRLFQQSDLISEMIHELRTPLNSILTASHLLNREGLPPEMKDKVTDTIQKEVYRLNEMTTSYLDIARLESGRSQFHFEPLNIEPILRECVDFTSANAAQKEMPLVMEIEEASEMVYGDAEKLRQVILNLLSNAIKYNSEKGKITIMYRETPQQVEFSVLDSGQGISPEHKAGLFEKFYRVPGSEKKAQGTGLGLSICKKIVETHGGSIFVESQVGKGSQFIVRLPVMDVAD